jgi:hypothetical protein
MWGRELLDIALELVKDILNALRDAIKEKDIYYFIVLIVFIVAFTAGILFAIGSLFVFITLLTSALKNLLSTITIAGFLGLKKGGGNENQNLEERRKT